MISIVRLWQTNKHFNELCQDDYFWLHIAEKIDLSPNELRSYDFMFTINLRR
jgi:hypothetical protein